MDELKLVSASLRVNNQNLVERVYNISASVSVDEANTVTGIYNGVVSRTDTEGSVAAFEYRDLHNLNYQFNGLSLSEQKTVIDECSVFLESLSQATVTLSVTI